MLIELPFPPSSLSGHAGGHWRKKAAVTKKYRAWARLATLEVREDFPLAGDIVVNVLFQPPNRRGDRANFPNRMKPYFDGIADALGVNDSRFVPNFEYDEPVKGGRVTIAIRQPEEALTVVREWGWIK